MMPPPRTILCHVGAALALLPAAPALGAAAGVSPLPLPQESMAEVDRPAEVLELSLEDALRIAAAENLTLAIERLTVETAVANQRGSWGAFDPVFDLGLAYSTAEQPQANTFLAQGASVFESDEASLETGLSLPITTGGTFRVGFNEARTDTNNPGILNTFEDGTFANAAITAGFTQPLLRGAWSRAATATQREAEIELRVRNAVLLQVRDTLVADVCNAYWDLVAAREEQAVRERALELAGEQLAQDGERLRVGVGTEVDVLQAETQVAQEEERLLRAKADVLARSDALKALILRRGENDEESWDSYLELWNVALEPLTELPPVGDRAEAGTPWTQALEVAFDRRPELVQSLLEIDRAQVRLDRAESDRLPGLNLDLTAQSLSIEENTRQALETVGELEFMTYTGALAFNLPLGNRTASYAERAARVQVRAARLGHEQVEARIVSEIRNAVREVDYQAQAVLAARKSREFTERQLQAEQARYEEGLSTTFQVLEFQQQLAEAASAEKAALAGLAKAEVALDLAAGSIADRLTAPSADQSTAAEEAAGAR
jgi:outer membrane protein